MFIQPYFNITSTEQYIYFSIMHSTREEVQNLSPLGKLLFRQNIKAFKKLYPNALPVRMIVQLIEDTQI